MVKRLFTGTHTYIRLICLGAKSRYRSFLGMALSALAAPLLIAAAFIAASPLISAAFTPPKLELVFCDLEGSAYFDTILDLLLADESITKTIAVSKLGYDESLAALADGSADAVVIFPEAFISDMSRGINRPIKILGNESDPIRTVFIKEFMQSAADELSAAQSAINTVWFSADRSRLGEGMRNLIFTTITLEYTSKAFARSVYYTFLNVPPTYEGSSPAAFLTASALAAFIFFGALSGIKQIINERRTGITKRLAASGVTGVRAALYHFIPIYAKQLLCACFAVLIALPAVMLTAGAAQPPGTEAVSGADGSGDSVIGDVIHGAMGRRGDADGDADTGGAGDDPMGADDGAAGDAQAPRPSGGTGIMLPDIPGIINLAFAKENAGRLVSAISVMGVLCLFTSALALFCGYMFNRAESADALIVTLGIAMAVAGGTVIPYPYMPDVFQAIGPFCFNKWAQNLIASALFGGVAGGGGSALPVFALLALSLVTASVIRIKKGGVL